jgi:predicted TPR repeat methyltransferase
VDWLIGIDLSPAMIAQARAKGLYDRLIAGELTRFLRDEAAAGADYHLVLAADVFVYCGDLFANALATAGVLAPGGLFAFTVETHDGAGVLLRETLRYAHSADHVRAALERAGLTVAAFETVSTRTEKAAPVAGLLVVARRDG